MADERTPIRTEDGVTVYNGDRVYDYYSMEPGTVASEPDSQGWFYVRKADGSKTLLNGQRICTVAYARGRGFPGAE
jgi:hypothetical protein